MPAAQSTTPQFVTVVQPAVQGLDCRGIRAKRGRRRLLAAARLAAARLWVQVGGKCAQFRFKVRVVHVSKAQDFASWWLSWRLNNAMPWCSAGAALAWSRACWAEWRTCSTLWAAVRPAAGYRTSLPAQEGRLLVIQHHCLVPTAGQLASVQLGRRAFGNWRATRRAHPAADSLLLRSRPALQTRCRRLTMRSLRSTAASQWPSPSPLQSTA